MRAQACRSRRSPLRRRSLHSACPLTADRAARQPGQRRTRPAILSTAPANPRRGATFPRLFGATSGNATEDAAVIAIAHRAPLHLFPSAADRPPAAGRRRRWPGAVQPPVSVRSTPQNAPRPRAGYAAGAPDVAPPPRSCRAARLRWPTARRWPGGHTLRSSASRACIVATASSDPGRSLSMRSCKALSWSNRQRIPCSFRRSHPPAATGGSPGSPLARVASLSPGRRPPILRPPWQRCDGGGTVKLLVTLGASELPVR